MTDMILSWLNLNAEKSVLALMHFLWQGTLVGIVTFVLSRILQNQKAGVRYWLHCAALLVCPLCVVVTFATLDVRPVQDALPRTETNSTPAIDEASSSLLIAEVSSAEPRLTGTVTTKSATENSTTEPQNSPIAARARQSEKGPAGSTVEMLSTGRSQLQWLRRSAPWMMAMYVIGVVSFLVRLLVALWGGHRLRTSSTPVTDSVLLALILQQTQNIGLRIVPVVAWCDRVAVPTVIGVLRPMILLPATLTTGLSVDELSAILSHEMAHIRRYDLWMNLLQRIVESVLFFHPVIWLLSRRISAEREICCDDLVIRSGHERMDYAGALLHMAELCAMRRTQNVTGVAATGRSESLLESRIIRLIQPPPATRLHLTRPGMLALLTLLMIISGSMVAHSAGTGPAQNDQKPSPSAPSQPDQSATADPHVRRDPFQLLHFREKFNQPYFTTPPEDSLDVLGFPSRPIEGRLVNSDGKPISGMPVAVQPKYGSGRLMASVQIHVSDQAVDENFDVTDEEGRFRVEATMEHPVLVFFSTAGLYRLTEPTVKDQAQDYQWPEPVSLSWSVPRRYAEPGQQIHFCQQGLWTKQIQPVYSATVPEDRQVRIQLPRGKYTACAEAVEYEVMVELSRFTVTPNMTTIPDVPSAADGAVIGGNCDLSPEKHYVIVTRPHHARTGSLIYQVMAVDMVRPAADGFFATRKLPPGAYVVKLVSTNPGASPRYPVWQWRVQIQAGDPTINLSGVPADGESKVTTDNSVRSRIEQILSTRFDYSGLQYLLEDVTTDHDELVRTLFEILNDSDCPDEWRSPVREYLFYRAPTSIPLIDGAVATILDSQDSRSRDESVRRIVNIQDQAGRIIQGLRPLLEKNGSSRMDFLTILSKTARRHPQQADTIHNLFEELLQHSDPQVRLRAAMFLSDSRPQSALPILQASDAQPGDANYEHVVYCTGQRDWQLR
ncbi:MAG: M56 family metallopeptidase [Planctomycetaceae bacterium]